MCYETIKVNSSTNAKSVLSMLVKMLEVPFYETKCPTYLLNLEDASKAYHIIKSHFNGRAVCELSFHTADKELIAFSVLSRKETKVLTVKPEGTHPFIFESKQDEDELKNALRNHKTTLNSSDHIFIEAFFSPTRYSY
ncbi:MAG: hypothetical protein HAW67_01155 [Endozoicomonadaceae bacterium]|nr:hypothetical protein [Endozoicomonadaceae bacterium]